MTAEAPRIRVTLAVGDNVRIVDGPFQDFEGRIDEVNVEKGRVKVLVSFFGRETPSNSTFCRSRGICRHKRQRTGSIDPVFRPDTDGRAANVEIR